MYLFNFPPLENRNKRSRETERQPAGHAMLSPIDKYAGGVFTPDDIRTLVAAFDDTWRSLLASGIAFESDEESEAVRDALAKHIIEQAAMANVTSAGCVTALCCNTPSQS
jgi:hypothetical protein